MFVTYRCLNCDRTTASQVEKHALQCAHCGTVVQSNDGSIVDGELRRCLVCPSTELFVRKDFSQRLGISIIVTGFVASSIAWAWHQSLISLAILISTAALDAILYLVTGNVLTCYRCHSEYRDVPGMEKHPAFELDVHERIRQQAARLAEAQVNGRSNAPHSTVS